MKILTLSMLPALVLFCCSCAAGAKPPAYPLLKTTEAVTVDGKLDEECWKKAASVELIFPVPSQTGPKRKTEVRLVWDGAYLYAGYQCEDQDIVAQHTDRDDYVFEEDCVELFLCPSEESKGLYFGLEMNCRGTLYDYIYVNLKKVGAPVVRTFNLTGVKIATQIQGTLNKSDDIDEGWSLEVAVPLSNFLYLEKPMPEAGSVWRTNLNRWNGTFNPNRIISMWSQPSSPEKAPHDPPRFGYLNFCDEDGNVPENGRAGR